MVVSIRSGARAMDMVMSRIGEPTPGWMCSAHVTVPLARKPIAHALHFLNAAARREAEAALNKARSDLGEMTRREMDQVIARFVHKVPVYRGALKCDMAITLAADALATAKEKLDEQN
jgi:hypothetical protein